MKKQNNVSKFTISKKLIMLGSIIASILIIIVAIYVTEFTKNSVSVEKAFTIEAGYVEVSEDEFLKHFTQFDLKEDKLINPYLDENSQLVNGKATISLKTEFDNSLSSKKRKLNETTQLNVTVRYGADWFGYIGSTATFSNYSIHSTSSTPTTRTISDYNLLFPASKLLFIRVSHPEMFAVVKWSFNSTNYYTLLEHSHKEYKA